MKRKFLKTFLKLILLFSILPYLVPLSSSEDFTIENSEPFPESEFAIIDSIAIHYRAFIPKEVKGKTLMVHGMGGSTFSWRHNIEELVNNGQAVILVDLPGFGYSDRQRKINHSQENRSEILWGLLNSLDEELFMKYNKSMKWNLVGHSMGGGTIAAMAVSEPSKVNSLVFVAGAVYHNPTKIMTIYPPVGRWIRVIAERFLFKENRIESFLSSAYQSPVDKESILGYYKPLTLPGTSGSLLDIIKTSGNIPITEVKQINHQSLLIWGDLDTWLPIELGERLNNDLINSSIKILYGSGHCPMETHPEEFNKLLSHFLSLNL